MADQQSNIARGAWCCEAIGRDARASHEGAALNLPQSWCLKETGLPTSYGA